MAYRKHLNRAIADVFAFIEALLRLPDKMSEFYRLRNLGMQPDSDPDPYQTITKYFFGRRRCGPSGAMIEPEEDSTGRISKIKQAMQIAHDDGCDTSEAILKKLDREGGYTGVVKKAKARAPEADQRKEAELKRVEVETEEIATLLGERLTTDHHIAIVRGHDEASSRVLLLTDDDYTAVRKLALREVKKRKEMPNAADKI